MVDESLDAIIQSNRIEHFSCDIENAINECAEYLWLIAAHDESKYLERLLLENREKQTFNNWFKLFM